MNWRTLFAGRQTRKMTTERPLSIRFMSSACCTLTLLFLLQKKAQWKNTHTFDRSFWGECRCGSIECDSECNAPNAVHTIICVCNAVWFAKNSKGKIVVFSSIIIDVPLPLNRRARSAHPKFVHSVPLRAAPSQSHFGYVSHTIYGRLSIAMSEMICISLMRPCVQFPRCRERARAHSFIINNCAHVADTCIVWVRKHVTCHQSLCMSARFFSLQKIMHAAASGEKERNNIQVQ